MQNNMKNFFKKENFDKKEFSNGRKILKMKKNETLFVKNNYSNFKKPYNIIENVKMKTNIDVKY